MCATITLTNTAAPHSSLFSSSPSPSPADEGVRAQQQCFTAAPSLSPASSIHSSTNGGSSTSSSCSPGSFTDTWPMAVEALAQRLWDCGREALSRRNSSSDSSSADNSESKLVFDETREVTGGQEDTAGLCDGPYVRVDYSASPPPPPPPPVDDLIDQPPPPLQQRVACGRPPLIHYQPRTNPFKTMMRVPATMDKKAPAPRLSSATIASRACRRQVEEDEAKNATSPTPLVLTLTGSLSTTTTDNNGSPLSCTHCKRGNFLEFCFVSDRCSCRCHDDCPCNPCLDIKDHRRHMLGIRQQRSSRTLLPSRAAAARAWVDDGHPPQHRQPSLCTLTT